MHVQLVQKLLFITSSVPNCLKHGTPADLFVFIYLDTQSTAIAEQQPIIVWGASLSVIDPSFVFVYVPTAKDSHKRKESPKKKLIFTISLELQGSRSEEKSRQT